MTSPSPRATQPPPVELTLPGPLAGRDRSSPPPSIVVPSPASFQSPAPALSPARVVASTSPVTPNASVPTTPPVIGPASPFFIEKELARNEHVSHKLPGVLSDLIKYHLHKTDVPKNSLERWIIERTVYCDTHKRPCEPYLPPFDGKASPSLYREIMEDLPIKVRVFASTAQEARNEYAAYASALERVMAMPGAAPDARRAVGGTIERERAVIMCSTVVRDILDTIKNLKALAAPLVTSVYHDAVTQICLGVARKSHEYALRVSAWRPSASGPNPNPIGPDPSPSPSPRPRPNSCPSPRINTNPRHKLVVTLDGCKGAGPTVAPYRPPHLRMQPQPQSQSQAQSQLSQTPSSPPSTPTLSQTQTQSQPQSQSQTQTQTPPNALVTFAYGTTRRQMTYECLCKLRGLWRASEHPEDMLGMDGTVDVVGFGDDGFGKMPSAFFRCAFALLLRYGMGVGPRGSTLHAAVPRRVFDYLYRHLGVVGECFASPLNCYLSEYHSADADLDAHFNSSGSFFANAPVEGMYEANPPFIEEVMLAMVERMEYNMTKGSRVSAAPGTGPRPLGFVVFVPDWEGCEALERMSKSKFLRREVRLAPKRHIYVSGDQHSMSTDAIVRAVHGTKVYILQNDAARALYPVTPAIVDGLERLCDA